MIRAVLITLVKGYRLLLSPWLGSACRFEPTCSAYSLQALERHGAAAGSYLTLRRLVRCHPWCEGGCDPVPETPWARARAGSAAPGGDPAQPSLEKPRLFTQLLSPFSAKKSS
ncbi:membrane protein insertion efficiency factor YidD [Variovorax terrae]|uniref:Putative membrane protein insertion efficiency factor n=1 Tax=Variovorax terrae TaxID=2923278 RepID=A0A9X1VZC1_9BURK|nr:membrane protein insertion efficiency factor YidD [Variovorax terrae]MCJ0765669.1 membrane protein insertion efficiency factor YidD [Variovorax terrae]